MSMFPSCITVVRGNRQRALRAAWAQLAVWCLSFAVRAFPLVLWVTALGPALLLHCSALAKVRYNAAVPRFRGAFFMLDLVTSVCLHTLPPVCNPHFHSHYFY